MTKRLRGNRPETVWTPGERRPVSFRASPELKEKLDAASAQAGISLMNECERRLQQSFDFEKAFGGPRALDFFRSIALQLADLFAETAVDAKDDWMRDPREFSRAFEIIATRWAERAYQMFELGLDSYKQNVPDDSSEYAFQIARGWIDESSPFPAEKRADALAKLDEARAMMSARKAHAEEDARVRAGPHRFVGYRYEDGRLVIVLGEPDKGGRICLRDGPTVEVEREGPVVALSDSEIVKALSDGRIVKPLRGEQLAEVLREGKIAPPEGRIIEVLPDGEIVEVLQEQRLVEVLLGKLYAYLPKDKPKE